MRHYEIIFMVHPDKSEQVPEILKKLTELIDKSKGALHRVEDWGRRQLSYPIAKLHKAHYVLLNLEIKNEILEEIKTMFRFNDFIIRNLVVKKKHAVTGKSPVIIAKEQMDKKLAEKKDKYSGQTKDVEQAQKPESALEKKESIKKQADLEQSTGEK